MKLVKFRIENYKSIVDSGDCYFSDGITILAGKNESGKTSILEALEDFDKDRDIRKNAQPIGGDTARPRVSVTFLFNQKELKSIYGNMRISNERVDDDLEITLVKELGCEEKYRLDDESWCRLLNSISSPRKSANFYGAVQKALEADSNPSVNIPLLHEQEPHQYLQELQGFQEAFDGEKEQVVWLQKFVKVVEYLCLIEEAPQLFVREVVDSRLPSFILFSSFEDVFPDQISLQELENSEWAVYLESVSVFKIATILSADPQQKQMQKQKVNANFKENFQKFWTQDDITLTYNTEDGILYFWVQENGEPYKPSQRSKGQQWFLSFYIKVVARILEDRPNVILIDEPGLYLHAKAQKDILNVLETHTRQYSYPFVFSTHSPYLLTMENIENVRLVEKREQCGTRILGKVHAGESADKETLTPILTAIGLGVNDSITNIDQLNNVVVEGIEDVFYLQAFRECLPEQGRDKINFINGGGAPNMPKVGAILQGWGANVKYLLDHDKGGKGGAKRLKRPWGVSEDSIKLVSSKPGSTVDLLSSENFREYVLEDSDGLYKQKGSNSQCIKDKELDKVLLARQFLQFVKNKKIKLDDQSTDNIKELFQKLDFKDEEQDFAT